ncbi:NlpC/P60 family protein [Actinoplanes sp. NPDC051411]|uniref:NlpC/P60 family protein n=1 Tax=Actinoplanes sp. NPDC051411 TaxID=3155522 RepID=UPI00343047B9
MAALFNPLPALADPAIGQGGVPGSVPDAGSRPIPAGALVLPGQSSATATTPITTPALSGSTNPILQKIQKGRDKIETLGDQLIGFGQDRTSFKTQVDNAQQLYQQAENDLRTAEANLYEAAQQDWREAAAMPPGLTGSGLQGLDDLAHLQHGQTTSSDLALSQLQQAQIAAQIALDTQSQAETQFSAADAKYTKLQAEINKLQAAQQKLENANQPLLNAAEASQAAADSQLGSQILAGSEAGRGADPRAVQALQFALSQRGKPYVWSTEGPNTYDCSGLMYRAYHNVGFPLVRVSRDQYWQTRNKVVDRYSLLPGDLLFFSYTNSWTGIHHVAMYAGDGMMVEAPRTGLNVRLVPVRWTELFQATRVFGSVEGGQQGPDLGNPDPQPTETTPAHTGKPTTKPPTSKPPTSSTPSHSASPSGSPSTSPSGSPSTSPSHTTSPSPTKDPSPTGDPSTSTPSPTGGDSTSPSSSGGAASAGGSTSPSSTEATKASESASKSASASKSVSTSPSSSDGTK